MTQCKDIDNRPILERIWDVNHTRRWANCTDDVEGGIAQAFPPGTPAALFWAKMRKLFQTGLVEGCSCGCRGDYVVTLKGCAAIGRDWHGQVGYSGAPR